ncbi:hypothetical protein FYJ26_01190 [Anaerococcus sp. WCA-380-WT-2B]|uniref:Bacterial toxin 50 domain-containing protein n=2 Tax=Anaerococcus porci TaxID=2652269 RepID=A0A6N7VTL9_9FIRM|nr:polymorphic toxin type 50 domain-containing protein [Anaerococcus porci]MSS77059.1 hypothetical protein [Anaerococcus porci]
MDKDIVPELAKAIDESFKLKTKESRVLKDKLLRLKKKMANHEDSSQFAKELGDILADAFKDNLKDGVLPDGKMYYNIADRLINPRLKENYNIINDYGKEVQTRLNKDAGISIKAIDSGYNEDKVRGIVNYVSNSDKYEDAADTFYSSIENFSMSVIDNLIRSNADFHYKAGLSPKIIRKSNGHCCDWCSSLVCVYDYKDVKDNGNAVFRRHRHCDCTVIYDPRDGGKKRNVHTHKEWTDSNKDKRLAITARSSSIYIAKEVRKGNLKLNFNKDHYEKHIEGTKRFDDYYKSRINKGYGMQSILSIDYDIAQRLINDNFGKGIVTVTKSGKPRNEENINFNRFIGYYVYRNKRYPTTKGKIIYSKKGSHIVPIKGEDFD